MAYKLPQKNRAWRVVKRGPPSKALVLEEDLQIPEKLPTGHVLLRVQAAALNPIGYKLMKMVPNSFFKRVAESDLAGEVLDANGTRFQVGDKVFGMVSAFKGLIQGNGALANFATVDATGLAHIPSGLTPTEAAGLGIAGITAYQALFNEAKLEAGQTVFINGGSSSVGSFAIQLAKARGIRVVASASSKNEEYVRGLGADEFFDYTKSPLHEQLIAAAPNPKYHAIIDAVGLPSPALHKYSEAYLAPKSLFISAGPNATGFGQFLNLAWNHMLQPRWAGGVDRDFKITKPRIGQALLLPLRDAVEKGEVKPVIDSVYDFDNVLDACERILTNRARGKVIIKIAD